MIAHPFRMARFSTDDFPAERRLAAYREIYGATIARHDIEPIEGQPFHFEASFCKVPGLGLASSVFSPCRRTRGPQHLDNDDLILGIGFRGGSAIRQRGREIICTDGAVLTSCAEPMAVDISSTSHALSLRIPNAALAALIPDLNDRVPWAIPRNARALSLLIGYAETIRSNEVLADAKLCELVVVHVHDLISLVLGAEGDARHVAEQRGAGAARRAAILRNIERHSADPGLTAGAVAVRLGITPRYVHLLLEETGLSFSHHVLERRLERAAALLRDPAWDHRRIADVASEAGFADLSHFNRVFRRRFGATPTDIRESARRDERDGPGTAGKDA